MRFFVFQGKLDKLDSKTDDLRLFGAIIILYGVAFSTGYKM